MTLLTENEQQALLAIKRELTTLSSYRKSLQEKVKKTDDRIDTLISKKWKLQEKEVGVTVIKKRTPKTIKKRTSKKQQPLDPIILEELKRRGLID